VGALESLYARYRNDVEFFMIYIKEAHPTDGWQLRANVRDRVLFKNHVDFSERVDVARQCSAALKLSMPTLVDSMDNAVNYQYSAWPDRVYVIGIDGRIVVQAKHGPFGFPPGVRATEEWLAKFKPEK
jgi:hypothetical protein